MEGTEFFFHPMCVLSWTRQRGLPPPGKYKGASKHAHPFVNLNVWLVYGLLWVVIRRLLLSRTLLAHAEVLTIVVGLGPAPES